MINHQFQQSKKLGKAKLGKHIFGYHDICPRYMGRAGGICLFFHREFMQIEERFNKLPSKQFLLLLCEE